MRIWNYIGIIRISTARSSGLSYGLTSPSRFYLPPWVITDATMISL